MEITKRSDNGYIALLTEEELYMIACATGHTDSKQKVNPTAQLLGYTTEKRHELARNSVKLYEQCWTALPDELVRDSEHKRNAIARWKDK